FDIDGPPTISLARGLYTIGGQMTRGPREDRTGLGGCQVLERRVLVREDADQGIEPREAEERDDPFLRLHDRHLPPALLEALEVADELPEPRGVERVDPLEVEEHRPVVLVEHLLEELGELARALAELHDALELQHGGRTAF